MWIAKDWKDYELLDCGGGEKLERWDRQVLVRPDPQAIWETDKTTRLWRGATGRYSRSSTGGGHWDKGKLPESWQVHYKDLTFQVKPMNFKHTGLFPEQAVNWDFAMDKIRHAGRPIRVLNLFAYTGGATVACAGAGASVCHVDAAKGMVAWGKENARLSGLGEAPIRWIVDDCAKFVEREIRRGKTYDAIIMDAGLLKEADELDAGVRKELAGEIQEQSVWLMRLMENILNMTKLESEEFEIRKNQEVVDDLIYEAVSHIIGLREKRRFEIKLPSELIVVNV